MPTPIIKIFRPFALGTEDDWQNPIGTDTKVKAVDPLEPISHDENATRIQQSGNAGRQSFLINRNFPDNMGLVTDVSVFVRYSTPISPANARMKVGVALTAGPTFVDSADIFSPENNYNDIFASLTRPGGGAWVEDDFHDTTFQMYFLLGTGLIWCIVTSLWLAVTYDPTDEGRGAVPPELPARKLRRSRLLAGMINMDLRGDTLDIDLLTDFEVSHRKGVKVGGKGYGEKPWEPRRFRCFANDLNLNNMSVHMSAYDLYDYFCMFWWLGIAPYTVKSDESFPDGHAELHPGVAETFTRAGTAHILDGSNIVQVLASGFKRFSPDGLRLESGQLFTPIKNRVINSSFFNGTTSWTLGGTGANALDTKEKLFSDEAQALLGGANRSLKLTTASGVGTHKFIYQDIAGHVFGNGENSAFTVWRKDNNSNFPGSWAVQDQSTSKWWNATSGLWQAGAVSNYFPAVTDKFTRAVNLITAEAGGGATWRYYVSSSAIGNNDSWYSHIQVEFNDTGGLDAGSSPIPTFNSTVQRQHEYLVFSNPVGRRIWPAKRGTVIIRVKFFFDGPLTTWSADPVPHENSGLGILCNFHNFSNWMYLNYNYDETLDFTISNVGGFGTASIPFTAVNEQTYVFAVRWTSENGGELDLPSRTISVFKDGVKGTDDVQTADIVEIDNPPGVVIGNPSGVTGIQGVVLFGSISRFQEPLASFSHFEVLPWCLTDEEIAARSQL